MFRFCVLGLSFVFRFFSLGSVSWVLGFEIGFYILGFGFDVLGLCFGFRFWVLGFVFVVWVLGLWFGSCD